MARPIDANYRTMILNSFDKKFIQSTKDVENYLREKGDTRSYQTVRRNLIALADEKILTKVEGDKTNNQTFYMKSIFADRVMVGKMTLRDFLHHINTLEDELGLFEPKAFSAIKRWMAEIIAIPAWREDSAYESPVAEKLFSHLMNVKESLSNMHLLISTFERMDPLNELTQKKLAKEMRAACFNELIVICDKEFSK